MDNRELARRSILGFGELTAALGQGMGGEGVVRRPDALGARLGMAADNPWFDAAVVPLGAAPPVDDPTLPGCLWTVDASVPGRVEKLDLATPCLGVALGDPALRLAAPNTAVAAPSLGVIGDLNEQAYGDTGTFGPLIRALDDERVRTHGWREGHRFVCVALTLQVGDDLSVQYVATAQTHRRQGLASTLLLSVMAGAREQGVQTATLQASAEGLPVWERLGFRQVALLRGYLRSAGGPRSQC